MAIKYSTLLIVFCFCLAACHKKTGSSAKSDYQKTYSIDYVENEIFDWHAHMEIEEIIPLEFSDSSMISMAQDCLVTKDNILIHDYKQHCLFAFDRRGKYLYSINNIGNGPGEYLDIRSFCLNDVGREIIINDGYKLLFYKLSDGTYLHSIPLKLTIDNPTRNVLFFSCINPSKDTYYLWTDMADYTLYKYDGKEMIGLKPRTHYQLGMKKFLMNYKGDYLYCPDYGEFGISTINGDKRFYIDFGDKELPAEKRPQNMSELQAVEKEPYFKAIMNVQETESGIYVSALSPRTNYYDIYINKNTGTIWKGHIDPNSRLSIMQVEGKSFYALFYPYIVNEDSPLKKDLSAYITFGDNPILIKFRMKDAN